MGFLFSKQYLPYQELRAFKQAEKYAYLVKDTLNAIINYQNQGEVYSYLGNKDSIIAINLRAAKLFKQYGNDYAAAIAFGCNGDLYIEKKDTLRAKEAFKTYFSTGYKGNSNYDDSEAYILCLKGEYYMFASQYDSAYYVLKKSLKLSKSYGNKSLSTRLLAQFYERNNQPTLAMRFSLLSSDYNDSCFIETRKSQLQQMQSMYDYSRNQEIARLALQKAEQRTKINYLIAFACIILILFLTYVYRKNLSLRKKRILATQMLYDDTLLKLKRAEKDLYLLEAENDKKLSRVIKEKENSINQLKEEIKEIREKFSQSLLSDTDLLLMESSIYKKLKYIEVHPKEKMRNEDWKTLEQTIENLVPSFIPVLKNQLNDTDYYICLLVRLGFSTSFIANLLGLSASAISSNRKRMLIKICNKSGKPKDFDDFINKLG